MTKPRTIMQNSRRNNAIHKQLLTWYAEHQRDLPWRQSSDPYAIWLSEMMLQQTQVATVIPYYHRFLERFPDVAALARADQDEVLKLWEGLGYYSRARNLHRTAQMVVEEFDGSFPQTITELKHLPGIGPYTAGAIASIAFDLDEPVLDGNVKRVLCRLDAIKTDPRQTETHRQLWERARQLIPTGQAGLFNQALMDLGATICTPRQPQCLLCPVRRYCYAQADKCQEQLPIKTPRPKQPHYDIGVGVIIKKGRVLIDRRHDTAMLGGLWEFPGGKRREDEALPDCVAREVAEELGIEIAVDDLLVTVKHSYTHFRITLHAYLCRHLSGRPRALGCAKWKWAPVEELNDYAFPKANHRIIELLQTK